MCTAISFKGTHHLFGRTLDAQASYGEKVVITPRRFEFSFIHEATSKIHEAIIGAACISGGVPLYFDAMNESGLAAAGLNFNGNAVYHPVREGCHNVASFELIPWILCSCRDIEDAAELLSDTNITRDNFSPELPTTPLHFIFADKSGSIAVESVEEGLKIYDNPYGVLTNNPPFQFHRENLKSYMSLSSLAPENRLCKDVRLTPYSFGMGAVGLPGDFSSSSRFVRAVFSKNSIDVGDDEINGFFHLMDTVTVPKGCVRGDDGMPHYTLYTSCADTDDGVYCYSTYKNRGIVSLNMEEAQLDSDELTVFDMV